MSEPTIPRWKGSGQIISPNLMRPIRSEEAAEAAWKAYCEARDKLTVIDLDTERRLREFERVMEGKR